MADTQHLPTYIGNRIVGFRSICDCGWGSPIFTIQIQAFRAYKNHVNDVPHE